MAVVVAVGTISDNFEMNKLKPGTARRCRCGKCWISF